jgi:hypothetical protein
MSILLYDLSVMSYLQILGAVDEYLEKGRTYCLENNIDLDGVIETRIHSDMLPFRFQIQSVAHHSIGAIDGIKHGVFRPPEDLPAHDYIGLQQLIKETRNAVQNLTATEINDFEGRDVLFEYEDAKLPFTTEGFILSFSLPNLYFHATTAYDILRATGVPVGKRDFLGSLRLKNQS